MTLSPTDLATRLESANPLVVASGALAANQTAAAPSTDIEVWVGDNVYNLQGYCGDYVSLTCAWPRNAVETGRIVLKGNDPLVHKMRACSSTVVPVVINADDMQWGGRVQDTDFAMDDKGNWTLTAALVGDTNYLNHVLCWVNFLTPVEYQGPLHEAVYMGPACTVVETLIAEQCFRLQSGMYDMINNLSSLNLNWQAWFGTWLESNGDISDMLHTPVYVIHHDWVTDTSPFVELTGRFDVVLDLIKQTIKDNGLDLEVKVWRPGDPQPDPDNVTLTVATYVVTVTDRSGITGPTGTIADGFFEDFAQLQQGVFGENLSPFEGAQAQQYAAEGIYIAPEIGVDFVPPWAMIIADAPNTPLLKANFYDHHTMAYQIVIGGKSPQWLDDMINSTLEYAVDALMILVGFTGIPNTLLDGLFDDTLLAFELADNEDRRIANGPYCYPEQMFPSASAPYNVDSLFSLISGDWDTRGWTAAKVSFLNGAGGLKIGKNIFRGGLMAIGLQATGEVDIDYVENIVLLDDRTNRARVEVQVGDGKLAENAMALFARKNKDLWKAISVLTMQDQ